MHSIAIVAAAVLPGPALADVITIRSNEWCPYNCETGSEQPGYMVEVLTEAFAYSGHSIRYENRPRNRALRESRMGMFDGLIGAAPQGVARYVIPATPLARVQPVIAVRAASGFSYQGVESFDGILVSAEHGYNFTGEIDRYLTRHANDLRRIDLVFQSNAGALGLRKLLAGRIDALLGHQAVLSYLAGRQGVSEQIRLIAVGAPVEVYVAFSPAARNSRRYAALFDIGMSQLARSGRLDALRRKYGLEQEP
ncbi:substrate-binding periplasmic protein [Leisingera thetidis]|uniref:substrate-binding periplasmic protein n=1 Tax=Leisingera thetidis TaxID=2930199 RepID=UPI0021F7AE11|nr:transporter substrate-binding domain-containing protein [Leisingera thetidis]